jgi:hypothetical protein
MTLRRISSLIGALALAGVLVSSTYGAQAAPPSPRGHTARVSYSFQAPTPHKYGSNGMRMGLHCETSEMS